MIKEILWLHEKALNHDYIARYAQARIIHIWDNAYYQQRQYSLKRLVFIYETLCAIPNIEIIHGDTHDIMLSLKNHKIIIPYSADSIIKKQCHDIAKIADINIIKPNDFVQIGDGYEFTRFFKYWNKAKKTAFLIDGKI